ncbi:MAG TPA: DUF3291 domain-containing protein [Noviherbaspirillum sp.]|jgi:heme-degrading monooxygenase HmoA|uniref:DUF3291 domain-containing protein n=1 Tax=Noviherbaspirillum sp. TaxID=1926288 RepID=UPI002F95B50B
MHSGCHLAQVNIARMRGAIGDPVMAAFVERLDRINALAESSPGFVWRLKSDGTGANDATALQAYDDERVIVNLSVWRSPADLKEFVYRGAHAGTMKRRREWFERLDQAWTAMWWIRPDHRPTIAEAKERLKYLQLHGPSEFSFGFGSLFPAPGAKLAAAEVQTD